MSAFVMTQLHAQSTPGGGTRTVEADFRGPSLAGTETGYDTGGSVLDLSVKPAAALPATDDPETAPMLPNTARKVEVQISSAFENIYRVRYVPGTGSDDGTLKVFEAGATLNQRVVNFDDADFAVGAVIATINLGPLAVGTRFLGGDFQFTELFVAADLDALTMTIGTGGGLVDDLVNSVALNGFTPADIGVVSAVPGALAGAGLFMPAAAEVIELDIIGNATHNLNTTTAGQALVRWWTIDNEAWLDPSNWAEVTAGTDLSALTLGVVATGG